MKILKNNDKIEIELLAGRPKRFFLLKCIIVFSIIAPIAILVAFLIFFDDSLINFTFIFTFLIFWGVATYFIRLYLWNRFGTEHYIISQNKLNYFYRYKYFKDRNRNIDFKSLKIGKLKDNTILFLNDSNFEINNSKYSLVFYIDNEETIITETKISLSDIIEINNEISELINTTN